METGRGGRVRRPSPARGLLMGAVAMVLVGTSVSVSRTLVGAPLLFAQAARYGAAALAFLTLARWSGVPLVRPRGQDWLWLGGIAAAGLVLFNVAVVRGLAHAGPAAMAVPVACAPIVLGIAGPLMEQRTVRGRTVTGALAVTIGSVLVEGTGHADAAGVVWAVVVLVCETAFTLLAVPVLSRHGAWGVSFHSAWMATLMLMGLSFLTEGTRAVGRLSAADWAAAAYLAAITVAAFVLWYSTVWQIGAGRAGLLTGIAPVAAAAAGAALGAHVPGAIGWLGIAVVMGGLSIGLWPARLATTGRLRRRLTC